ncbi:MAG: pyridoxal-dependent decarboxylase [Gammaproteobacteria bacterium]|nr:pyridoxal-dependent decarboxylase [Gammaproteobacteria bacterium]MDH5650554.1 pyridoxal-dependent decarboxylase [Gammaproteobacteria bacterium]
MITRRQFLKGATAVALAAGCVPPVKLGLFAAKNAYAKTPDQLQHLSKVASNRELFLGYPVNMNIPPDGFFKWKEELFRVGVDRFAYNNVGNPYVHSHIPFNTHEYEKKLILNFAPKYGFDPAEVWGFLTNSGTDSNMHGIYMGRTILESRTKTTPKIYFTKEAHYSMQILRDLLGLEWVEVGTNADGSMDINDLAQKLAAHPQQPALVVATIGTTFKGAIDDIDAIQQKLHNRAGYLHLDAALFGGYLPHSRYADDLLRRKGNGKPRYDSIAVSCHKFFGFASPAGLFMTTQKHFAQFLEQFGRVHDPEYILQIPGTITCSRDAVKPAEFYYYSTEEAFARQIKDARSILDNTAYLYKELQTHYARLQPVLAGPKSNTIYFRDPGEQIVNTYSLATMQLERDGKKIPYAHVVVMPHVNKRVLDRFLEDLRKVKGRG